jgi:LPXTG-motif cell wall-anchored protein
MFRTLVRLSVLASAAAIVTFAPSAGATTAQFPAGSTTFELNGTFSLSTAVGQKDVPLTGEMKGTSDGSGNLSFPASTISFPAQSVNIVVPATITPQASSAFTSTVDTTTGLLKLDGKITAFISIPSLGTTGIGCPLGPVSFHLSTAHTGGKAYKPTGDHATATVSDTTFTIPKITNPPSTCPSSAADTINSAINSSGGSLTEDLTIFPPGIVVPSTTTTTTSTTTTPVTAASPSTTAAHPTLPNTGKSSTFPLGLTGTALVAAGSGFVASTRRRTRTR